MLGSYTLASQGELHVYNSEVSTRKLTNLLTQWRKSPAFYATRMLTSFFTRSIIWNHMHALYIPSAWLKFVLISYFHPRQRWPNCFSSLLHKYIYIWFYRHLFLSCYVLFQSLFHFYHLNKIRQRDIEFSISVCMGKMYKYGHFKQHYFLSYPYHISLWDCISVCQIETHQKRAIISGYIRKRNTRRIVYWWNTVTDPLERRRGPVGGRVYISSDARYSWSPVVWNCCVKWCRKELTPADVQDGT